jgi:hypothetical protein
MVIDMVKRFDRRIGLRMLYSRYDIPKDQREKYRQLWSEFWNILPDAFEKEMSDASEIGETAENDGNSGTPAGQTVPEEQGRAENVKKQTA